MRLRPSSWGSEAGGLAAGADLATGAGGGFLVSAGAPGKPWVRRPTPSNSRMACSTIRPRPVRVAGLSPLVSKGSGAGGGGGGALALGAGLGRVGVGG